MHTPITKPKPFCFVLMPFDLAFDDTYEFGIKGACADVDVYCERVDEQIFLGSMLDRIFNQIARADVIIADMTGRNPNVFYEVGYAHALGKTVVLLTQRSEDIPFDLKHFPHIVYGAVIKDLRVELAKRIQYFAFEMETTKTHQIGLELYLNGLPLTTGDVIATYVERTSPKAIITVHNPSGITYNIGDFNIGVITPPELNSAFIKVPENEKGMPQYKKAKTSCFPDGRYLHVLQEFEKLFPNVFLSTEFFLQNDSGSLRLTDFDVLLRLFSSDGYRDFPLGFRKISKTTDTFVTSKPYIKL